MIGFRDFLIEGWYVHGDGLGGKDYNNISAEKNIHGRKVKVNFSGHRKSRHYEVSYDVDGAIDKKYAARKTASAQHGREIAHHASKTIHRFINRVKPKSVYFSSHDPQKQRLHDGLAKRLAKKHGGKVSKARIDYDMKIPGDSKAKHGDGEDNHIEHRVTFKRRWR